MVERAVAWQFCPAARIDYTAIDAEPANVAAAQARLHTLPENWTVHLEAADLFEVVARPTALHRYDLLIANAFLDLVDIPRTLPRLRHLLKPGGLFYFTINFDGATILQPTIDPVFDALLEALYHRTMDERITDGRLSGDSRSGRHLFGHLAHAGFEVHAAGASDWVVHPRAGLYPADEAYFLHFIVHTMQGALQNCAELDPGQLAAWIETRHRQIEQGRTGLHRPPTGFLWSLSMSTEHRAAVTGVARRHSPTLMVVVIAYLVFIFLGIPDGMLGIAWPSMRGDFGLALGADGRAAHRLDGRLPHHQFQRWPADHRVGRLAPVDHHHDPARPGADRHGAGALLARAGGGVPRLRPGERRHRRRAEHLLCDELQPAADELAARLLWSGRHPGGRS
jgi:SAM-dependent methyltransferase